MLNTTWIHWELGWWQWHMKTWKNCVKSEEKSDATNSWDRWKHKNACKKIQNSPIISLNQEFDIIMVN